MSALGQKQTFAPQKATPKSDRESGFSSAIPDGLPLCQPLRNERRTFLIVAIVQNADVGRIGAPIDTGCPRVHIWVGVGAGGEVAGRAVSRFGLDLAHSVQLRRVRIQRTLTLPIIEES